MNAFITNFDDYLGAIGETLFMVFGAMIIGGGLGLAIGIGLYATRPGHILANRPVFAILNLLTNIVRPIPFIIFIVALGPITIAIVGTTIGTTAATFALSLAAAFAVGRIVEQSLVGVPPGVVEAARAMGASPWRILFTVVIPEGLGPLVLGYTFIFVGVVDMSAQAGIIGGGGLGDYAVTYGAQRYNWPIVYITVGTIVAIVIVGQMIGNRLARAALRR